MVSIVDDNFVIDMEQLCEEVRVRPTIWDRTHKDYNKKRTCHKDAWNSLCTAMMPEFLNLDNSSKKGVSAFVRRRWTSARDNYHKYLKNLFKHKKFGTKKPKEYTYGEAMKFLDKVYLDSEHDFLSDEGETGYVVMVENSKNELQNSIDGTEIEMGDFDYSETVEVSPKKKGNSNVQQTSANVVELVNPFLRPAATEPDDRNMLFFKSILPSLKTLSEDEVLEFQIGVMNVLKTIKDSQKRSLGIPTVTSQCSNCSTVTETEVVTTS